MYFLPLSAQHLFSALFADRAGVNLVHVPYAPPPAMNDVMAGAGAAVFRQS